MTFMAVSNRGDTLNRLEAFLSEIQPDAELICFDSTLTALAAARQRDVDAACLQVEMPELNGIDLGQYIQELHPLVNLIFISRVPSHGFAALSLHASGYVLEPVSREALRRELNDLRHPATQKAQKRVFAQTFGNFELFVDGTPVAFKYTRTKEIVALLVNNRGAQTTNGEIIGALWEDEGDPEKKASYLSNLRQDLQNTLAKHKLTDIIVKQRGSMAIATERIECDLFDWLARKKASKYQYLGDYMNQYSWAEYIHAELDEISWSMEDED